MLYDLIVLYLLGALTEISISKVEVDDVEVLHEILSFLKSNYGASFVWDLDYLCSRLRASPLTQMRGFFLVARNLASNDEVVGVLSVSFKDIYFPSRLLIAELGDAYIKRGLRRVRKADSLSLSMPSWKGVDEHYVSKSVFGMLAVAAFEKLDLAPQHILVGYPNSLALRSWVNRLGLIVDGNMNISYIKIPCLGFLFNKKIRLYSPCGKFFAIECNPCSEVVLRELRNQVLSGREILQFSDGALVARVDKNRNLVVSYVQSDAKPRLLLVLFGICLSSRYRSVMIPSSVVPALILNLIPKKFKTFMPAVVRPGDSSLTSRLGAYSNQLFLCDAL